MIACLFHHVSIHMFESRASPVTEHSEVNRALKSIRLTSWRERLFVSREGTVQIVASG